MGEIIESETLNMHAVMISSSPPILYWAPETLKVMRAVQYWRQKGLESYFTIDAGATVHVICRQKDEEELKKKLSCLEGVRKIIVNHPGRGARLLDDHLF
jgi:diphosphomevalonate decarboxylase